MISPAMGAFLSSELSRSKAQGEQWRLIGNAIPMAKTPVPDLESMGITMPDQKATPPGTTADLVWKGRWSLPLYPDTWDGYAWAREQFYSLCKQCDVSDLLVLTGDSHSFWANRLTAEDGQSMGLELGTAGISSPGDFIEQGFDHLSAKKIDEALAQHAPDIRWTSNLYQGYVRLILTPSEGRADYVAMSTVKSRQYSIDVVHSESINRNGPSLQFA